MGYAAAGLSWESWVLACSSSSLSILLTQGRHHLFGSCLPSPVGARVITLCIPSSFNSEPSPWLLSLTAAPPTQCSSLSLSGVESPPRACRPLILTVQVPFSLVYQFLILRHCLPWIVWCQLSLHRLSLESPPDCFLRSWATSSSPKVSSPSRLHHHLYYHLRFLPPREAASWSMNVLLTIRTQDPPQILCCHWGLHLPGVWG